MNLLLRRIQRLIPRLHAAVWRYIYERFFRRKYPKGWHSFDRAPWLHPWLTRSNLESMRAFSRKIREEAAGVASKVDASSMRFAFVGNMANSSYQRMSALKQIGLDTSLFPHPDDAYVMSQPEWEEYDGVLPDGLNTMEQLRGSGIEMPEVSNVVRLASSGDWRLAAMTPGLVRFSDYVRWPHYLHYSPVFAALQEMSALYTVQAPYLAYLSRRPYVATHMGGDIWYECSRGDALGALQRHSFSRATALTISNPWSPAFARRYGFRNMVILPMILNTERYCPGTPRWREEWRARVGGNFFVLCTARVDDRYKGSNVALEGFARLAAKIPGVRLVVLGWGSDLTKYKERLLELGIADRTLLLPLSGKRRLIQYLRSADCLLDQFALGYFGLTALEAMSVGLPVVMRIEAGQYDAFLDTGSPPVMNATTVAEVATALACLADNPVYRKEISEQSLAWFERSASPQAWGKAYRDLLVAAAVGHRFDFRDSPLSAPIGRDEQEYHRRELSNAPTFPNYH